MARAADRPHDRDAAWSAPVVVRPIRRAARGDGVVEDLILVTSAGHAELAGAAAIVLPGAEQELVGPAAVARAPDVAAALLCLADADPERGVGGAPAAAGWMWRRARAPALALPSPCRRCLLPR